MEFYSEDYQINWCFSRYLNTNLFLFGRNEFSWEANLNLSISTCISTYTCTCTCNRGASRCAWVWPNIHTHHVLTIKDLLIPSYSISFAMCSVSTRNDVVLLVSQWDNYLFGITFWKMYCFMIWMRLQKFVCSNASLLTCSQCYSMQQFTTYIQQVYNKDAHEYILSTHHSKMLRDGWAKTHSQFCL